MQALTIKHGPHKATRFISMVIAFHPLALSLLMIHYIDNPSTSNNDVVTSRGEFLYAERLSSKDLIESSFLKVCSVSSGYMDLD